MDRINNRIAQVYGYAVCFITVIVMLFSIKGIVDALIDLSDPIRAAKFRATRSLVGNGLLIIVAGVLFVVHWRWLKQHDAIPVTG